jgi:hypothetical protein
VDRISFYVENQTFHIEKGAKINGYDKRKDSGKPDKEDFSEVVKHKTFI